MEVILAQSKGAVSALAAASVAAVMDSDVLANSLLVVCCGSKTTNINASHVTDSLGTTYVLAQANDGGQPTAIVYGFPPSAGANTITLDCGTDLMAVAVAEFRGLHPTLPFELGVSNEGSDQPASVELTLDRIGILVGVASSFSVTPQSIQAPTEAERTTVIYSHPSAGINDMSFVASFKSFGPGTVGILWTFAGPTSDWWACGAGFAQERPDPLYPNYIGFPKNIVATKG